MKTPGHLQGMSVVVQTTARMIAGFILIYGIYMLSPGHAAPGGGFVGGVIVVLTLISLRLACGKKTAFNELPKMVTDFFEHLGILSFFAFLFLAFLAGYFGSLFGFAPAGTGKGFVLYLLTRSLEVWIGIFSIFSVMILLRFKSGQARQKDPHV